jgi:glyoxylase-like metal-dependent hydrolase (beta-lactamase superfamily II)
MHPHALDPHPEVRLVPLSPRVTVAYGPVSGERWQANATIVVGDRATAVMDAMMTPQQTAPVRLEAERLGDGRPVRWVVLTHADPDHVLGRVTFDQAAVVGSARSAAVLRDPAVRSAYAAMAERSSGDPATFAMPEVDVAFDERATVDLGGVTLEGVSVGPGHSASDTLWWCPEERIAWSGDQVFHGAFPLVRTNLANWLAGLDRLAGWGPRVVVPGHGPVADRGVLDDQRRLLETLASEVGALLGAGASVDEAVERVRMDDYRGLPMAGERLPAAVRGAAIALGYDQPGGVA